MDFVVINCQADLFSDSLLKAYAFFSEPYRNYNIKSACVIKRKARDIIVLLLVLSYSLY